MIKNYASIHLMNGDLITRVEKKLEEITVYIKHENAFFYFSNFFNMFSC